MTAVARTFPATAEPADAAAAHAARLRACFQHVASTRMAGLPICNPALGVAVPALLPFQGEWLGALVTPWAISLVLLPGEGTRFRAIGVGDSQDWDFPSGRYSFLGHQEADLGAYQTCSLASPVFEFADQAAAETFALAALEALLRNDEDGGAARAHDAREAARLAGLPAAAAPVSRRAFLRGALFGGR